MYDLLTRSCRFAGIVLGLACCLGTVTLGAGANALAVEKLLTGLKNPHGVAVRPEGSGEGYEVFVAESGAGRVVKIRSEAAAKRIDVVSGFSIAPASDDSFSTAGVYSLYFLDHMRLAIAGGDPDGTPFVRIYELPEPASPLTVDQHKHEAKVPESAEEPKLNPRVFRSIARTQSNGRVGDFLLAAAPSTRGSTALIIIPVHSGTLGEAAPNQLENANGALQIGGITVGGSGYVTIALNSFGDSTSGSRLAFFSPLDRRMVMQVRTDLQRIVALAYSPKSGNLFAANSPTTHDERGGIYRIDRVNRPVESVCVAAKIADVQSPTALAFGPDGALFVTAAGNPKSNGAGVLLKLTGDLVMAK